MEGILLPKCLGGESSRGISPMSRNPNTSADSEIGISGGGSEASCLCRCARRISVSDGAHGGGAADPCGAGGVSVDDPYWVDGVSGSSGWDKGRKRLGDCKTLLLTVGG